MLGLEAVLAPRIVLFDLGMLFVAEMREKIAVQKGPVFDDRGGRADAEELHVGAELAADHRSDPGREFAVRVEVGTAHGLDAVRVHSAGDPAG